MSSTSTPSALIQTGHQPIAVVGVSALFPGSTDATGFWADILANRDLLGEVPPSHWLIEDYYDPDPTAEDKTYARRGGFLPTVDFDSLHWGVPPSTIPATDTAQLLALMVAEQVLQDAWGKQFQAMNKDRMSCILGVTSAQELLSSMVSRLQRPVWIKAMREAGLPESEVQAISQRIADHYTPWQEATFPGLLGNVVAGRIANRLGLGGTNCVTDAACASTFSALHMAVNELYLGDSDVVIAGGVDTMNEIFMYMCFSKTPALSPSGDCKPFSDSADGTMLGEGLAMVALKRLADAERDGDHIYAVVQAVGSSSDGRSKSVYAPVSEGQAKAIRRAYARAGFGADTVELVEAHGTGTKAGDAAEFGGLRMVFDESGRPDRQWCAIGSVKSQIGHTKAAAGAAGLFKAVMALHHKVLPPTAKVERPNPKLELETTPFHVNTRARPWVRGSRHPRRAGVSSFGFGGSNFHVALEEYTGAHKAGRLRTWHAELVVLAADSAEALAEQARALALRAQDLRFEAWSCAQQPPRGTHRLAIVATDLADLRTKIEKNADKLSKGKAFATPDGLYYDHGASPGELAFLFPGQGSQYVDMGAEVAMHLPAAARAWELAADVDMGEMPLHDVVFPRPVFTDAARQAEDQRLTATQWAQPGIGASSLALLGVARSLGLEASHVAGHSYGEVTALHAAGMLSATDMLRVARRRGELMAEAARMPGSMTAIAAPIEELRRVLAQAGLDDARKGGVVVANHNHPSQVVLSGATDAVERAEKALEAQGMAGKRLNVATAFHSPVVSESAAPFTAFLQEVEVGPARATAWCNATAAPYDPDAAEVRRCLGGAIAEPVRFVEMIEAMWAQGVRSFVEVGPGNVLTRLVDRILKGRAYQAVELDRVGRGGLRSLLDAAARLYVGGHDLRLSSLWEDYKTPEDPATRHRPKLAVPINGANVGKPYPPRGGAAALPRPNPERPKIAAVAPAAAPVTPAPVSSAPVSSAPVSPAPVSPAPVPAPTLPPASAPTLRPGPTMPPTSYGPSASWLQAFQDMQRQTAEAHTAYQQAMAESHAAFLQTAQTSIMGLASLAGASAPTLAPAPVVAAPQWAPAPVVAAPAPVVAAPAPVVAAPAPVVAAPAPVVAAPAPVVAAPVPAAKPAVDLVAVMLAVVADKTGYPAEMLSLSMDLEGDLGVDSIKRVEILSAMKERVPGLPEVDPAEMAALRTLGQIVDTFGAQMPAAAPSATPAAAAAAPAPAAKPAVDLVAVMLAVVADKTGYPAEMLSLSMDLEGDLGVDSIKRVEILSAMKERVPGLPEVDPAEMAALRTLGQIVDTFGAQMPAAAPAVASAPSAAAPAPAAKPAVDLVAVMLAVVADKTGYPAEMLSLSMDLEGDLGVDSIKRVEILSAMKERVPGLPEVDPAEMAALRTLGQIVDTFGAQMPAAAPAPAAAAAPTAKPAVDLVAVMLAVVADKTGYPAEMLSLSMDLEGDLGVDSIKRVEILSAMKERVPGLPEVDPAEMAAMRTLGQIVARFEGPAVSSPPSSAPTAVAAAPASEAPASEAAVDPRLGRFVLEAVATPAPGLVRPLPVAGTLGITADGGPLAHALARALSARGQPAIVGAAGLDLAGLVIMSGLRASADSDAAHLDAFRAARALASTFTQRGGLLVTVQDTGGDFGLSDPGERGAMAGFAALARTVVQEWPLVVAKAIDLQCGDRDVQSLAEALAEELLAGGPELEVGLKADGERIALRDRRVEVLPGDCPLGPTDTVLVSGGARGVTAATVIALAARSQARFLLLGRSAPGQEPACCAGAMDDAALKKALMQDAQARGQAVSPAALGKEVARILADREIRATLAAIEAAGGQARYVSADVNDALALGQALQAVRAEWGPLTGLVHGAGVLRDKLIADKTDADFQAVWATKVGGLRALLDATAADPLKVLVLFSSVAARCGNQGQVDYAMANEVLNKIAQAEAARRPRCVVKAMGWGPWAGGMVTPALKARFESLGVPLIPLDIGARMLVDELCAGPGGPVGLVLGGKPRVGRALASKGADCLTLDIRVDRRRQPYLADHAIQGVPVVPVVLAVEWFARAAMAFRSDLHLVEIDQVKVLKGIQLPGYDGAGDRLQIEVRELKNGDGALLSLELKSSTGTRHYSALARMSEEVPDQPHLAAPKVRLEAWDGQSVYGGEVLFHGPAFQVIRDVEGLSSDGVAATLSGVDEAGWLAEPWMTDVAALDGGLQLALLWTEKALGGRSLPTGVGSIRLGKVGRGPLRAVLEGRTAGAGKGVCDLLLLDAAGDTVAEMTGVETHVLPRA